MFIYIATTPPPQQTYRTHSPKLRLLLVLQTYLRWGQICAPPHKRLKNFISHAFNIWRIIFKLNKFPNLKAIFPAVSKYIRLLVLNKTWKTVGESTGSIEWLFILVLLLKLVQGINWLVASSRRSVWCLCTGLLIYVNILLRAARGARSPNLQVITHASHVRNQLSFGLPIRMNGMYRTQSDHACLYHL